jgi:hypothetical protein
MCAELEAHMGMLTDDYIRRGISPEEARRAAALQFGGIECVKDSVRDQRRLPFVETTWQDVRYAARTIRKAPGLAGVAILSLALGIGANTAIFSVTDAMLVEYLPVKDPAELVEFVRWSPSGAMMTNLPAPVYGHFREEGSVLAGVLAFIDERPVLRSGGTAQRANVHRVSESFFPVLGVQPFIGRTLDEAGGAVLSHHFWKTRFGADPNIVGTKMQVGDRLYTVAGVMPQGFFGVDRERVPDLWLPLGAEPLRTELWVLARLKPGVTAPQARAALGGRFRRHPGGLVRAPVRLRRLEPRSGRARFDRAAMGRRRRFGGRLAVGDHQISVSRAREASARNAHVV